MHRRTLLAAAPAALTATLATPSLAQPAKTLRFVPYVDLPLLDPVANTASQVRNHAFLVWDTLWGLDDEYRPAPQMLAGHDTSSDGLTWTLTLRQGLRFHDNEPVLAKDAVASIRRWGTVDGFGQTLMAATNELDAPDDRTIRFRLKRPFPLLPNALGKISPNICPIMPERLASQPASKPIAEAIGSGPYRFLAAERVPGSRIVYERFAAYLPSEAATTQTGGAKRAYFDRVEWQTMPEPATAAAALRQGAVDWIEAPPPDLLPLLRADPKLVVRANDRTGVMPILRFNMLHPPFDNLALRRAVLAATQQSEFMTAFSDDPANTVTSVGVFCPGTPMATKAGLDTSIGTLDIAAGRRAVQASGYKGEKLVLMGPTDHPVNSVMAQVGADLFKKLGLNVDYQAMDAGTMFQRRTSRAAPDKGGWSCFPSAIGGIDALDPAESFLARGNGDKAWYGWPTDPEAETLRASWFDTPGQDAQLELAAKVQRRLLDQATFLPLGQILQPTAYRRDLVNMRPGFAKFWSVRLQG